LEARDVPLPGPVGATDEAERSSLQAEPRGAPPPLAGGKSSAALAVGGAGVVSVVIGAVFGLKSISKHSDYEASCAENVCSTAAAPIHDDAVSAGDVSTV